MSYGCSPHHQHLWYFITFYNLHHTIRILHVNTVKGPTTHHLICIQTQNAFLLNKCTSHMSCLFVIYLFVFIFLSVLDYCNLVNSHLKSSHWPDALKSMILIFTITIRPHRDWKTQSKKETSVWFSALYFVWCLFFIVITKRKKYI